ncbi:hypothetical protein ACVIWV_008074 [Bradyrhizobium diazoefficiens]
MACLAGSPPVYYQKGSNFKGENWRWLRDPFSVVVLDKRAKRAPIQDPLPQEAVWRRLVVTIPRHGTRLG